MIFGNPDFTKWLFKEYSKAKTCRSAKLCSFQKGEQECDEIQLQDNSPRDTKGPSFCPETENDSRIVLKITTQFDAIEGDNFREGQQDSSQYHQ
jgi:hypothetical protein